MARRSIKLLVLYLIIVFGPLSVSAQDAETRRAGEITGTVTSEEGESIPNVSIALLDPTDESILSGSSSDDTGEFSLATEPGSYILQISYIGSADQFIDIEVSPGETLDLGTIRLQPEQAELDEVLVEGQRSYMEMNFDSRSFNVGQDITSMGGSALDVLDNVPSITTDFEGNVSLRGSEGVQILINGRPSNLVRGGTDGLSSIPASMIEEIEVITNPSARYDADGTGGIINIKLVDDTRLGFNGNIQANSGYPHDHGLGTNLNYHVNNINWFLNLDLEYAREPQSGRTFQSFS
ncbi:MAG: TonB-dependent receptor, partial [Balneolaceae bacterium]